MVAKKRNGRNAFDEEGVERALLAALDCVYQASPHFTLAQFLIAMEIAMAEREGEPHTLVTLVRKLDMPFSTASRAVWALTEEGGDLGIVKYRHHPTDRRKKLLIVDSRRFDRTVPRALRRAMVDYYGYTVEQLRRAPA